MRVDIKTAINLFGSHINCVLIASSICVTHTQWIPIEFRRGALYFLLWRWKYEGESASGCVWKFAINWWCCSCVPPWRERSLFSGRQLEFYALLAPKIGHLIDITRTCCNMLTCNAILASKHEPCHCAKMHICLRYVTAHAARKALGVEALVSYNASFTRTL